MNKQSISVKINKLEKGNKQEKLKSTITEMKNLLESFKADVTRQKKNQ